MNLAAFLSNRIRNNTRGSFSAQVAGIAIISIALGITIMILSFAILEGFERKIKAKLFSFGAHMQVSLYDLNRSYEESPFTYQDRTLWLQQDSIPYLDHIQRVAHKAGLLKAKEDIQGIIFKGIDTCYSWETFGQNIIEGEIPNWNQEGYAKDVIISKAISKSLKLKLKDSLLLCFVEQTPRFRKVRVSAIYETGLEEIDQHLVLGDIRLIRRLGNWDDSLIGAFEIWVENPKELDAEAMYIWENYAESDLKMVTISEDYRQIFDWLDLLHRNVILFLVLIVGVCAFVIVATLIVMIMERIPMIGVLKAFGARNQLINRIFLHHGLVIVLRGMLFGNAIGLGLCAIQYFFQLFPLDPENYYMAYVPIHWNPLLLLGLNLAFFLTVMLFIWIPVLIIGSIKPIKSIRFN